MNPAPASAARLNIVHEDDRLLVLNKPADLVCHPTKSDAWSSLIGRVRLHLGNDATAHMLNRLDRETTGLVLVAKDDALAREIRRIWQRREVVKEYEAIVHGWPLNDAGEIDGALGKDAGSRVAIKDCVRPDGAASVTRYEVVRRFTRAVTGSPSGDKPHESVRLSGANNPDSSENRFALLKVTPLTGRKHQIRIHLAHLGHPVVGDKLYGHDEDCYLALVEHRLTAEQRARLLLPNHALHAGRLRFVVGGEAFDFRAEPDESFRRFLEG